MKQNIQEKFETAIWVGKSLFDRGRIAGSAANISFLHNEKLYISASGSSFGRLTAADFARLDEDGQVENGVPASKEWPLHRILYKKDPTIQAVIHTHSPYATFWSCVQEANTKEDPIPSQTPYLNMRVGSVAMVPYAPPGTPELFQAMEKSLTQTNCYLLKNHGPILGDKDLLHAFYGLEELEEASRNAWMVYVYNKLTKSM